MTVYVIFHIVVFEKKVLYMRENSDMCSIDSGGRR